MINYSIIIPHKNIPNLLIRCLRSIPKRNDIEIIVVDDNSDDGAYYLQLYPELLQENVTFIINKEGNGAGAARNIGLDHAKGNWIIFSDADDFFTEDLPRAMDFYINNSADVILFPIKIVDSESLEEGNWRNTTFNNLVYDESISNKDKLLRTAALWSKFIKRDFIEKYHIRCEEIPCSNDQMFSAKVGVYSQNIIFDKNIKVYTLTYRSGSLTRNRSFATFECRLDAEIRFYKFLNSCNIYIVRNTYRRYIMWAASFGLKNIHDTHKRLLSVGVTAIDNKIFNSIPFLYLKAFTKGLYIKLLKK